MPSFACNKTPGLDKFSIEWYTKYKDVLVPLVLRIFNNALEMGSLPPSKSESDSSSHSKTT